MKEEKELKEVLEILTASWHNVNVTNGNLYDLINDVIKATNEVNRRSTDNSAGTIRKG